MIFESIKALESRTSLLFNLKFAVQFYNAYFFFFSINNLHFLISAVITLAFNTTSKLVISIGMQTKEAKSGTETDPVTVEIKTSKC